MQKTITLALISSSLLLTGCQTTYQQRSNVRSLEDQRMQQESQRRINGALENMEMEIARIGQEVDLLRSQMDSRCDAMEAKQEADNREMVNRLSGKIETLIKRATPPPAPKVAPRAQAPSRGAGYEHIVRPGETLSAIATAYGSKVKTVISVNKLSNPNQLKVGQKLFIPE